MKLLLFSDVHCSEPAVERLIKKSEDADVLVGAGDFGTMRRGTGETLAPFEKVTQPIVLVPGNAESHEELVEAAPWTQVHVLHGGETILDGVHFFGLGGGIPVTPFGSWSYDLDEETAAGYLADCPEGGVLVVHSPPYGIVDVSSGGQHLGSTAIRETIDRCQPRLTVCGHIHDCAGQWKIVGSTAVVNAGPDGILWDLEANSPVQ